MEAKGLLILQRGMPTQLQDTKNPGDRRSHDHKPPLCNVIVWGDSSMDIHGP